MNQNIIHPHTNLTNTDLFGLIELLTEDIKNSHLDIPFEGFEEVDRSNVHFQNQNEFIRSLDIDIGAFGCAVIFRKDIDLSRLRKTLDLILSKYPENVKDTLIDVTESLFYNFYTRFKAIMIKIEYYEILPDLDSKYEIIKNELGRIKDGE